MKKLSILLLFTCYLVSVLEAQKTADYAIPAMPDPAARMVQLKAEWAAVKQSPPRLGVRDCFMFLLDALDTKLLSAEEVEWLLKLVQTRMINNPAGGRSYGNIFWGWTETGYDIGDGNNIEFCMQYGILIKLLFDDRLSPSARKTLDEIFTLGIRGARNQEVRISYTNIYLMKIWNFTAFGQVYGQPEIAEEGRGYFNQWLAHVSRYGNREYDSPTYCGVDMESLLLIYTFINDADIKQKAGDALQLFLTDLSAHYLPRAGIVGGAHSRDYNRVFSRDLLEEKYMNPLLGKGNSNTHLFHQICAAALQKLGLTNNQQTIMHQPNRFILQRWDSLPHTFATDFVGNKFSIASTSQAYSPDDKPFVAYLSSDNKPALPNIAYVLEGRDDHYGTWGQEGMGEKMKHLMPANYPANGGWGKTRHLMPFMQAAQYKSEFVMLVAGDKDHNCIKDYLNSTIILPDAFDEIWMGDKKIVIPAVGQSVSMGKENTFFARFEDVAIALTYLYDNTKGAFRPALYNDGFAFNSGREKFQLKDNKALRLTLTHPINNKAVMVMWWKIEEGIQSDAAFADFRNRVLHTPVSCNESKGVIEAFVMTEKGKLGVKGNSMLRQRLSYYLPDPLPNDFLFTVNGKELGLPIMKKYQR